jgi:hypothetical protein
MRAELRAWTTLGLLILLGVAARAASDTPVDPGWPRVFKKDGKQLTVHQPQVDSWQGYTNLQFRCAISVKGVSKEERFGVAEVQAETVTDPDARTVAIVSPQRTVRFNNLSEPEQARLRETIDELYPPHQITTLALERVLAYLELKDEKPQRQVQVNLAPPKIFASSRPAILVIFMGAPQFRPVETNRTDLEFAINTNWDLLYDTASRHFYLLHGEGWLTASDLLQGPWTAARTLPPSINSLPADENWAEARKHLPGKPPKRVPTVFVSNEPAEMILMDGPPRYKPVPGTELERMSNTASVLYHHRGENKLYFLVAGRWFRAEGVSGPWSAASQDLPSDFSELPDDDQSEVVKASVPGTSEAKDAVLLASIPKTTTVNLTNVDINVIYSGEPKFVAITNTTVQYAVNSPNAVFLVDGKYYCCLEGAWFTSQNALGPWKVCSDVPAAIYSIPPSHPMHNVTYVTMQDSGPESVTYVETAGYSGEYVASNGVLMFGTGSSPTAEATADPHYYYYWYYYPCYYTYGLGAMYNYGYGGYYGGIYAAYGPYGGAGYGAAYNPYTGTYARASYAYGPYGGASRSAAYNPYTGAYAAQAAVNTAYGSAGRAAAYNPTTGQGAVGGYRSSSYGTAAAVKSTQGSAVAWNTQNGQGIVAKSASGNIYAAKDGIVYRQDANGSWWQNSGNGWQNTARPQPVDRSSQTQAYQQQAQARSVAQQQQAVEQRQNLERQAQARRAANQQAARARQYQARARATPRYSGRAGGAIRVGRR